MTSPPRRRALLPLALAALLLSPLAPVAAGTPQVAAVAAGSTALSTDATGGRGEATATQPHTHAPGQADVPHAHGSEDYRTHEGDDAQGGDGHSHEGAAAHTHEGDGCHGEVVQVAPDAPVGCAHADEPPPGVDVTVPVTTAEAVAREGAYESAVLAADELGAPGVVETAATPSVRCDGDGTSGYRVQAMYVVEVGRPNRYAELLPSLTTWAAGADAVVNRSAALTGGVRDVRFVHEPGTTDCQPVVLNVTVPAGGLASFGSSIGALQAQGYTNPARKYLMWTDTNVLCGIALQYLDDQPGQGNANNGSYPQYARTDAGCWGGTHSVEAHELLHTLGAVQGSAPHKSAAGHCTDDYDRMCYRDGNVVMTQPCPVENEALLDCGYDDYFSTYPAAGSYLDQRWNSADSRFLVGGGDGSDGGQAGTPTRLGLSVQVNSPGVPGLPTQATASLELPPGRTAGVTWRSSRTDCVLGSPSALQTSVTCPAATTSTVTLTAVATDSTGQTATAASPLTFSTAVRRAAAVQVAVDGQTGTYTGCTGAPTPVTGTVVDVQSGLPVLGVPVELQRRTASTAAVTAGTGPSTLSGTYTTRPALTDGQLWSARTRVAGPYDVATSTADVLVRTGSCSAAVTLQAAATTAWAGDTVAFSGTAVRTTGTGASTPVAAGTITLLQTQAGSSTPRSIGTVRTDAAGAWTLSPKVLVSGPVRARLSAGPGNAQSESPAVPLTVTPTVTRLAASASTLTTLYRSPVTVSGTLRRDAGGTLTPLPAARVQVTLTRPGTTTATVLGTATTDPGGAWSLTVSPTAAGSLAASYAAVGGQPAAKTVVGQLAVTSWTTATTLSTSTASVAQGVPVSATGSVTRTGGGVTQPAPSVPVKVYLQPAVGGAEVLVGSGTTRADGTYTVSARPTQAGTLRTRVVAVSGHGDSASPPVAVAVAAGVTVAPSTRTPRVGVAFTVRTAVAPAQAATVRLERSVAGGAWTQVQTATTSSTGGAVFSVTPSATGSVAYRVRVDATARTGAATGRAVTVTVVP